MTVQIHSGAQLVQGALSSGFEQPNLKLAIILFRAKILSRYEALLLHSYTHSSLGAKAHFTSQLLLSLLCTVADRYCQMHGQDID
jgi:hypothetical protein